MIRSNTRTRLTLSLSAALLFTAACQTEGPVTAGEGAEITSSPDRLSQWGGKADGAGELDSRAGYTFEPGQRLEAELDDQLMWASFELSRGQLIQLSFEDSSSESAFVYGPITHRDATPPDPRRFLERADELFVRGWERPSRASISATEGGHYLLVVLSEDKERRSITFETSCQRSCESRRELDDSLREVLPDLETLTMPARGDLAAIPFDRMNPLNTAKVELGRRLFHSPRLATRSKHQEGQGTYSCASCHNVNHGLGAGAPQGIGEGGVGGVFNASGWSERLLDERYEPREIDAQPIASPPALNGAYLGAALWNGALGLGDVEVPGGEPLRNPNAEFASKWKQGTPPYWSHLGFTGLETQAIVGLHVHRMGILDSSLLDDPEVMELFKQAFPPSEVDALTDTEDCYHALQQLTFPETYFSPTQEPRADELSTGFICDGDLDASPYRDSVVSDLKASLAIAAFERTLLATEAPFQKWLRESARDTASPSHIMTLDELRGARVFFDSEQGNCASCHTGPSLSDGQFHVMGLADLLESDRSRVHTKLFEGEQNGRGGWTGDDSKRYAFKTPQLYNLAQRSFFGHGSTHRTLDSMVRYMTRGEKMVGFIGGDRPLAADFTERPISEGETQDLITFVSSGLLDPTLHEELPAIAPRECVISADETSSEEQGCSK